MDHRRRWIVIACLLQAGLALGCAAPPVRPSPEEVAECLEELHSATMQLRSKLGLDSGYDRPRHGDGGGGGWRARSHSPGRASPGRERPQLS